MSRLAAPPLPMASLDGLVGLDATLREATTEAGSLEGCLARAWLDRVGTRCRLVSDIS